MQTEKSATLSTLQDQTLLAPDVAATLKSRFDSSPNGDGSATLVTERRVYGIGSYDSNAWKSGNPHSGIYEAKIARTLDALNCASPTCNQGGMAVCELAHALKAKANLDFREDSETYVLCRATAQANAETLVEQSPCLNCNHEQPVAFDARGNGDGTTAPTVTGDHNGRVSDYTAITTEPPRWIVRRLTPLECERLQGYPDGWTDIGEWTDTKGKLHKAADTPRYKALGNSIALPQWWWLTCKMARYLPAGAKLGSLFDGIGGFPLVWETRHGKGTARWASEIEEFPIAVTKVRFGE